MGKKVSGSMKAQRTITDVIVHIFLVCVAIIWLIPFVWLVAHSFRGGVDRGQYAAKSVSLRASHSANAASYCAAWF